MRYVRNIERGLYISQQIFTMYDFDCFPLGNLCPDLIGFYPVRSSRFQLSIAPLQYFAPFSYIQSTMSSTKALKTMFNIFLLLSILRLDFPIFGEECNPESSLN